MEQTGRVVEQIEAGVEQGRAGLLGHRAGVVRFGDATQRPEHVEDRLIRNHRAVRSALAFELEDRLPGESLAKFRDEPRFADSGFAADPDDLAVPANRGLEPAPQELDLPAAADERRGLSAAAGSRPLAAGQHEGAPGRELATTQLDEVEASLEKWRGRVAHQDGVRPAALDQRVERAHDRLLPIEVELGDAGALTDEDLGGVDGDLDGGPGR